MNVWRYREHVGGHDVVQYMYGRPLRCVLFLRQTYLFDLRLGLTPFVILKGDSAHHYLLTFRGYP